METQRPKDSFIHRINCGLEKYSGLQPNAELMGLAGGDVVNFRVQLGVGS